MWKKNLKHNNNDDNESHPSESAQRNKSIIIYKHEQYKISIIFKVMEEK
jgi:hypothetical protein